MKKLLPFFCVAGLFFFFTSSVTAGGIDHKNNFSAEWVRTVNRYASNDSADMAVYNPAGIVELQDGLHLNLTLQYGAKTYENTAAGTEYESDIPDLVPALFAVYKKNRWAGYFAFTIPSGGGTVDFKDGTATTLGLALGIIAGSGGVFTNIDDMRLKGQSYYKGFTLGGAYAITDMLSVSLGVRFIDAQRGFKGYATLSNPAPPTSFDVNYEETDNGWGGIIGLNFSPTKAFSIGARYETKTELKLETKVKSDTVPGGLVTDGATRRRDFPALLSLGASYKFLSNFRVEGGVTYYLNDDATWDDNPVTNGDETRKDNGYDVGVALEYIFNPKDPKWKVSVGYIYTDTGIEADNMSIEAPELNANTVAAGFAYSPTRNWDFNLGVLRTFYKDETTSSNIKLEKDVLLIGFGVQWKFL